jgi:predicted Zn-dependent protease
MGNLFYRIEKDLKEGRKKKACDRLRNMINHFPNDLSLRKKLGQIYFEAGFLDEAGKFWILSTPENHEMENAVEIYKKSLSNSGNAILKDIVFRGDKHLLDEHARKIIIELEQNSLKTTKHIPVFKAKTREKENYSENKTSFLSKIGIFLLIGFIILLPVLGIFKLRELILSLFSQ